jgi:FkbM family methyltransferase
MALATHNLLNRVLPMSLRTTLRRMAILGIPTMRHLDMPTRLKHLAAIGFTPGVIYDVGSASGDWARMAHSLWPKATIIGFEPNASRVPDLEKARAEVPGFRYFRCFLGPAKREVRYSDKQDQTSLFFDKDNSAGSAVAPMMVLDELIQSGQIPPPDFMKLDVQGFELEVLKGGRAALERAQAALLEVTFTRFMDNMPLAADVTAFMREHRFEWHDVMGIYRRHSDDALLQMDALYVKEGHPLRRSGAQ